MVRYKKIESYSQWWNSEVTLYRGDSIVGVGTIRDLAEKRKVRKATIYWLTMPTAHRRADSRKDQSKAMRAVLS